MLRPPLPMSAIPLQSAMLPALRRTQATAQAILQKVTSRLSTPASPAGHDGDSGLVIHPMSLLLPKPITTRLVSLGVEQATSEQISFALVRVAERLQQSCEDDYQRRIRSPQTRAQFSQDPKLPHLVLSAYSTIYTKTINDWMSYILRDFVPKLLQAQTLHESRSSSPRRRRPFNQNAIPLLEGFFATNAFPTRLDKFELALKCGLDYRQVHVWFQNHRSRYRKEGRELAKITPSPLIQELEKSVVERLLPDDLDDEEDDDRESDAYDCRDLGHDSLIPDADPCSGFHLLVPEHAFPAAYPPTCSYDPFPMSQDPRAFPCPWMRTPSSPEERPVVVDITELTAAFAKLSVDDPQVSPPPESSRRMNEPPISYLGFITPCSRAPHPAFVRRARRTTRSPCASSCRATPSGHPSSSKNPSSASPQPAATTSPAHWATSTSHSAKRALPRRVPKHPPSYRSMYGSVPDSSARRKSSVSSRASSILSSSAFSSSESEAESPLLTPLLLPDHGPLDGVPLFDLQKPPLESSLHLSALASDGAIDALLTYYPARHPLNLHELSVR